MKTKRSVRTVAFLLALCLCLTILPGTVVAQEAEAPTAAKREVTIEDVLAGIADPSQLYDPLDPDTVPEIIGYEEALNKKHAKRVYAEEGDDLSKVVFENLDGSKTLYLFDFPVKYIDENGKIQDIGLEIADSATGGFRTAANGTVTTFSAQASDGISLSGNGTNITLVPIMPTAAGGKQPVSGSVSRGSISGSTISADETVISHVASRVDEKTIQYRYDSKTTIEYALTYTGFKEDIVVSEYTGQTQYTFTLRTGGYALEEQNGSYFLVDGKGNIKATIGDIIIFTADERNNTMGRIVPTTVIENQEYLLTIEVDPEFLADENTKYPIRIDPTVEINYSNNGSGAIQDCTVYTDDTTNGYYGSIFVGLKQNGGIARILMKFPGLDLSSLGEHVRIESATVTLRDLMCESTGLDVYCHVYAGAVWNESAVGWYNTMAISPDYLSDQLDMQRMSYAIGAGLPEIHRYSFDITKAVQGWMDGNYDQNKGIVFKASAAVENGSTYNSKTIGSYNRASYKPTLSVTYLPYTYQLVENGTYYLNNYYTGKYLHYNTSNDYISGKSGLLADLGTTIQWEVVRSSQGNDYLIRVKDTNLYLAVPEDEDSIGIETVSVNNAAIPARCLWSIDIADGGGCLVRSAYNGQYLYAVGNGVTGTYTTGAIETASYYSCVWRITSTSRYGNTSSHQVRELSSNDEIGDVVVNIGGNTYPTLSLEYSDILWVSSEDFTYSYNYGTSGCVTVLPLTGVFSGIKCGIATYTATHKVTGRQITFKVYVDRFTYELTREFGFSDSDALLIREVYNKVDAAYPNDSALLRAWRSSRVLGGLIYDHKKSAFLWSEVAGSAFLGNEENYFTGMLGFTQAEYLQIKSAISLNYTNIQTADFAHMQISLSARLAYQLNMEGVFANIGEDVYDEDISYLAGWLGDATLKENDGQTSLKNDDYHADLDAENIYRLIAQGYTLVNAANTYYASLTSSYTRADVFLSHISYSTIKSKIYYRMVDEALYVLMALAEENDDTETLWQYFLLLNDEQYHLDIIMSYPDTYNFMCSVRDGRADIANYQ